MHVTKFWGQNGFHIVLQKQAKYFKLITTVFKESQDTDKARMPFIYSKLACVSSATEFKWQTTNLGLPTPASEIHRDIEKPGEGGVWKRGKTLGGVMP